MNWTLILIGFALAVFAGSALVSVLAAIRPQWSERRRRLMAAGFLPVVTMAATIVAVLLVARSTTGQGGDMRDLAMRALATLGGGCALLAWIGGLIGATLRSRRQRR
jgi:MFS family permease